MSRKTSFINFEAIYLDGVKMAKPVIQVMDSLGFNRGGLTKAVFKRLQLLSEENEVYLLTVAYQPTIKEIFEKLQESGDIPKKVKLLNFFEDFKKIAPPIGDEKAQEFNEIFTEDNLFTVREKSGRNSLFRYYQEGMFLGLKVEDPQGRPQYLEHHDKERPWVRKNRFTYWRDGSPSRCEYYDDNGKVRYRIYFNENKMPYLSSWVTENGYEYRCLTLKDGSPFLHKDLRWVNSYWLERKLQEIGAGVIYTDEPRTSFALYVSHPNYRIVTSIHTTHLDPDVREGSKLKAWVSHYQETLDNTDMTVFLLSNREKNTFLILLKRKKRQSLFRMLLQH